MNPKFQFVDTRVFRQHFQSGRWLEAQLRETLPASIYWIQPSRKVLWNLRLVRDFLINGDSPQHQRLVEEYLVSLESEEVG